MGTNFDGLGFNKQTETLLYGLNAQNLIEEFKKRNISTDVLHKLTKEDFIQLGADEVHAENMVNALHIKKNIEQPLKPHQRIFDKIELLQLNERQLHLIQDFLKYCRMRLTKERINSFIEPDKALSASQILCIAADTLLAEVNEAELKLNELEAVIVMPKDSQKYSYLLYSIPLGGLCIASYILFTRFLR